jgi:hypothetical protein
MALLRGFQKSASGDSTKVLNLIESSYLNRTTSGQFNTVEDVQGLIDTYKKLPQSVDVQTKIADLENKKLQVGAKLGDILSQKDVFDTQLQAGLDNAAKNNFKKVKSLIGSYASIYSDASDRYDKEVMSKIFDQYGTTSSIPSDVLDYRKALDDKAKFYSQLFNAYNVQDPTTGEIGLLNPASIAVQIDTNPTNGAVQHIDIMPSGQIDDKNYMRTEFGLNVINDLPNKKLPTYLRVNNIGFTSDGKPIRGAMLGNVSYDEKINVSDTGVSSSAGIITPAKEKVGFFGKLNIFSDNPAEKLNSSIDSMKTNGINFSSDAYNYDSQAVPNDAVLQMGTRVFYSTGKDGQILEISGANAKEKSANLDKYLSGIGKDPNKILPYKITRDYLVAPDGSSRIQGNVDANYFNAPTAPTQPLSLGTSQPTNPISTPITTPTAPPNPYSAFFGYRNTPTPPAQPNVGNSTPDIVNQGNNYFRNATNFFGRAK